MLLTDPQPFTEALEAREVRSLIPTELRTDLLDTLPAELRERATFSAGVQHAEVLQRVDDTVGQILDGETDRATARQTLRNTVESLGITAPEGQEGTLLDLTGDRRLNLILDVQTDMARGYGQFKQSQAPEVLDQWPAQELIRAREAREPRDWPTRWAAAGGTFYGERMIALKDDPIWLRISRFGLPYPPFDFGSGMDLLDVERETAEAAGLLTAGDQVRPQDRDFNLDLQAKPQVRDDALKQALAESLAGIARFTADGVLRLIA